MKFPKKFGSTGTDLMLVLLVAAATAGGWFYYNYEHRAPGPVTAWGNVDSDTSVVSFRVPGHLLSLTVEEGTNIKKGQLLATLDPTDLEHQSQIIQGQLEAATAQLTELQRGSRPQEIAAAAAQVNAAAAVAEEANAAFRLAANDESRFSALVKEGAVDKRTYDQIHTAWKRAQDSQSAANANVRKAREAYKLTKIGPRQEVIDRAKASVKALQAQLALSQTQLGYTKLFCPFDGTVMVKVARLGENLSAGSPVYTLTDLDRVWVRAYVEEPALNRIKLGQSVDVTIDSAKGKKFPGRLSFVSSEAEFTPKTVQTEKERTNLVYRIKVDLDNKLRIFKPGMPATIVFPE